MGFMFAFPNQLQLLVDEADLSLLFVVIDMECYVVGQKIVDDVNDGRFSPLSRQRHTKILLESLD